jgi:hypothetical protein
LDGWALVHVCTERFSADFGVDEWFNVFLRDGNDVYRTYFLQHGAIIQWIGRRLEPVVPHALRWTVRR